MNSRRPRWPDAPDRLDPLRYFLGVLVGLLDGGNQRLLHQAGPRVRPVMQVLHFDGGRVGGLQARLVQHAESEHLLGLVGAWDLHEGVDLPHCRDILGNEGLQLSVELHVRWLEPRDVLKQFLHFCRHLEARVVGRVVRARDVLLFVRLVFLVARLRPALDLLDPWVFWRSAWSYRNWLRSSLRRLATCRFRFLKIPLRSRPRPLLRRTAGCALSRAPGSPGQACPASAGSRYLWK